MKKFDMAIIGGDKRTACMAQVLHAKEIRVITYGIVHTQFKPPHRAASFKEALDSAGTLIFGIPFQKKNHVFFEENVPPLSLTELQRCLRRHHRIFGGLIPEHFKKLCEKREIPCFDFMKEESLTIFNAIATAEGAIAEALIHHDTNLHHSNCLVLGYGRCGMVLADKLRGLNACVTICSADSAELARADSLGMNTLPLSLLSQEIEHFEYLFNTIPAPVLTAKCLHRANTGCLLIDIASGNGGIDKEAANALKIPVLHCLGLPGKYAGQSSAKRLAEYVLHKTALQPPCECITAENLSLTERYHGL